jgi:hypothetical protein
MGDSDRKRIDSDYRKLAVAVMPLAECSKELADGNSANITAAEVEYKFRSTVELSGGKKAFLSVRDVSWFDKGDEWEGIPSKYVVRINVKCIVDNGAGVVFSPQFCGGEADAEYTPSLTLPSKAHGKNPGAFRADVISGSDKKEIIVKFNDENDYKAINKAIAEMCEAARQANPKIMEQKAQIEEKNRKSVLETCRAILKVPASLVFEDENERRKWRKHYNNLHNEGGDGYIPMSATKADVEYAKKRIAELG